MELAPQQLGQRRSPSWLAWAEYVLLVLATLATVLHLLAVQPRVGDVDFFYYLCYSRDIVNGSTPISDNRFLYFPGVYAFWSTAMRCLGQQLAAMQWTYLSLLLANSVFVGLVVRRFGVPFRGSWFAAIWYLVASSRFQGFAGATEPLATLPWLVGMWLWAGKPLQWSRSGLVRTLLLGACFGLTVYCKQQAGLLTIGAAWLLTGCSFGGPGTRRHHFGGLVLLPIVALATLLLCCLAEQRGLEPLSFGASTVGDYDSQGSPLRNLYAQVRADEFVFLAFAGCAAWSVWAAVCNRPDTDRDTDHDTLRDTARLQLCGLLTLSGLMSLIQFVVRPYHHYFLLALPGIVIGSVLVAHHWYATFTGFRWRRALLLALAVVATLHGIADPQSINLLRLGGPNSEQLQRPWNQRAAIQQDLQQLRQLELTGQRLLVIPARHNSLHYELGTCSAAPLGYSFRYSWPLAETPWTDFRLVLVIVAEHEPADRKLLDLTQQTELEEKLQAVGFRCSYQGTALRLYQRAKD